MEGVTSQHFSYRSPEDVPRKVKGKTKGMGKGKGEGGTRNESEVRTYAADSQLGGATGSCSWIAATVDATATATAQAQSAET